MSDVDPRYKLNDEASVLTPALAVYPKLIYENIDKMVSIAGSATRLRPHAKTNKTPQIASFLRTFGITKHKCATIAEAEMLAEAGANDIVLAYPMVGPNVGRLLALMSKYRQVTFRPIVDCIEHVEHLSAAAQNNGLTVEVLLDVNVGMDRTGTSIKQAAELYRKLADFLGIKQAGLHVYDGHINDSDANIRSERVAEAWKRVQSLIAELEAANAPIPRIVVTGTGGFPHWAKIAQEDPRIECSPGTLVFNDAGYFQRYSDLEFFPAAVLFGRVISKPGEGLLTIDLGSKAVAPDSDLTKRVKLLNVPDAKIVSQHEEHLVVSTPSATDMPVGTFIYAWPNHICPTVALHQELLVVENGDVVDSWPVIARDRRITV